MTQLLVWAGAKLTFLTYALLMPFLGMIVCIAAPQEQVRRGSRVFGMFSLVLLAASLTACGSSSKMGIPGTPSGSSTVTITASTGGTGGISHTAALTITVMP